MGNQEKAMGTCGMWDERQVSSGNIALEWTWTLNLSSPIRRSQQQVNTLPKTELFGADTVALRPSQRLAPPADVLRTPSLIIPQPLLLSSPPLRHNQQLPTCLARIRSRSRCARVGARHHLQLSSLAAS